MMNACYLPSIHSSSNFSTHTIAEILDDIRNEKHAALLGKLPKKSTHPKEYKREKSKLPAWAFNGTFKDSIKNDNFAESNGLFHFDIDGLSEVEKTFADILDSIPEIYALWRSPSGNGLKGLLRIPDDFIHSDSDFKKAFAQVEAYFKQKGFVLDGACKDVRRLCFVCSDKNIFIDTDARPFSFKPFIEEPLLVDIPTKPPNAKAAPTDKDEQFCINQIETIFNKASQGGYHDARLRAGKLAGGFVAAGRLDSNQAWACLNICSDKIHATYGDNAKVIQRESKALFDGYQYGLSQPAESDFIEWTLQQKREYAQRKAAESMAASLDDFPDSEIQNTTNEKIWNSDIGDSIEKPVQKNTLSFKLISHTVLMAKEFKSNWLIRGIIERGNLGLFFGNSAGGKSLLVQDMCFCIAAGRYFKGIETQQGKVVYICGEGFSGLQKRFKSLELHYGQTVADLHYSECPAAFMDTHSAIAVSHAVAAIGDVCLVVVDTLHRNLGAGDENSAQDIGIFLNNIDTYLRPKGAAVLIIHHSGHDAKERSRGSSSIRAAMDVEFSVTKDDSNFVTLKNTKMKEWEPIQPMCFKFKTIELGLVDEYDFPMNGVVLESTNEVVNTKTKRLSDTAQKILHHLTTPFVGVAVTDDVRAFCSTEKRKIPQQVIKIDDLRKAVYPLLTCLENSKRTVLKRGIDELVKYCKIMFYNDCLWIID